MAANSASEALAKEIVGARITEVELFTDIEGASEPSAIGLMLEGPNGEEIVMAAYIQTGMFADTGEVVQFLRVKTARKLAEIANIIRGGFDGRN